MKHLTGLLLSGNDEGEDVIGVPIGREQLFEVDVRKMMVDFQPHFC
jgi:hypothetical protein